MIGFAKINGVDLYSTYGIVFRKGTYNELLIEPKRKKGYEYNWSDENGIETDPNEQPVYERLIYNLPIYISATSGTQFFQRYNAFTQYLRSSQEFTIDFIGLSKRYKVRYSGMTAFNKLTTIGDSKKVGCYFTLQLTNDYPTETFPIV